MSAKLHRWMAVVLLGGLVSGCASLRARDEIRKEWMLYPGARQSWQDIRMAFRGDLEPGWLNVIFAPIFMLDLPASAAFDTVVMPYDLYRVYRPEAFEEGGSPGN